MGRLLEKTITFDQWNGGLSNVDLDIYSGPGEFSYSQDADILDTPDFLRPRLAMEDDSSKSGGGNIVSSTARVIGLTRGETGPGGEIIYAVVWDSADNDLEIWAKLTLVGVWNSLNDDTTGLNVQPPLGLFHRDGELFYFNGARGATAATSKITKYDIGADTVDLSWDDLNVAGWGTTGSTGEDIGGSVLHSDGNIYFWKGQHIGPYDGSTKPSVITPFNVGNEYRIVDVISWRQRLLIAANDVNGARTSKLFLLDPLAQIPSHPFDDIYDTSTYRIQALRELEGTVKVITALNYCQILDWQGGNVFSPVKRLDTGGNTQSFAFIRPTAVTVAENVLYFGTHNTDAQFDEGGIYAYGRKFPDAPQSLQLEKVNEDDNTTNLDHFAILQTSLNGESNFYMSWYDQSNYGMSRENTTRSTTLEYETVWIRPFPGLRSGVLKASLFHEDLGASGTITIQAQTGSSGSFATIFQASGNGSFQTVISNNNTLRGTAIISNAFLKGTKHKFKVTMTNGVQLEKMKFKFRQAEQR